MGTLGWSAIGISLVVSLIGRWIGCEYGALHEPLCRWLISKAATGYPIEQRIELEAEWLAIVDDTRSPTRKLGLAFGYWFLGRVTKTALRAERGFSARNIAQILGNENAIEVFAALVFYLVIFACLLPLFVGWLVSHIVPLALIIAEGVKNDVRTEPKRRSF